MPPHLHACVVSCLQRAQYEGFCPEWRRDDLSSMLAASKGNPDTINATLQRWGEEAPKQMDEWSLPTQGSQAKKNKKKAAAGSDARGGKSRSEGGGRGGKGGDGGRGKGRGGERGDRRERGEGKGKGAKGKGKGKRRK